MKLYILKWVLLTLLTKITQLDNSLKFEFKVDTNIKNIDDAEEAIWCIFEPVYSTDGNVDFTIEGIVNRQYYTLKILTTPEQINIINV